MGRKKINVGQEIISPDLSEISAILEQEMYERFLFELIQRVDDAFFDDSLKATFLSSTQTRMNPGLGMQLDASQTGVETKKRPMYRSVAVDLTHSPPDASLDRIDIITVQAARANTKTETRNFKDEVTAVVSGQSFTTETDWEANLVIVAGTPAASPVAPATPAGFLKIAEVLVTAVTGIAGAGAITDTRTLMPIGGGVTLDTTGFVRITAGLSTPLSTVIADIEALLVSGLQDFTDYIDQVTDPAAPAVNRLRVYNKGNLMFTRDNGGAVTPLGSGGGGGGGLEWQESITNGGPIEDNEFDEKIYLYEDTSQELVSYVKVPQGYVAGRQIQMFIGQYSPSAANTQLLGAVTTLIRKNNDAINSTTNQRTSTNTALTNTVANQSREAVLDLTSATGTINGVAVSPGDLLKVQLTRGTDTDTADIRFVPGATEVKFG